jgi:hypothetical protein
MSSSSLDGMFLKVIAVMKPPSAPRATA